MNDQLEIEELTFVELRKKYQLNGNESIDTKEILTESVPTPVGCMFTCSGNCSGGCYGSCQGDCTGTKSGS